MAAMVAIVLFICIGEEIINCHLSFVNLLFYLCAVNERGCPQGLRLYPMNLIRTVPAEGLDFKNWCTLFHLD